MCNQQMADSCGCCDNRCGLGREEVDMFKKCGYLPGTIIGAADGINFLDLILSLAGHPDMALPKMVCIDDMGGRTRLTKGKVYTILGETNLMYVVEDDKGLHTAFKKSAFKELPMRKYGVGQIIDIRYVYGGLPNRVKIVDDTQYDGNDPIYKVVVESNGSVINMTESFIDSKIVDKNAPVWNTKHTKKMYADGWRFFGNIHGKSVDKKIETIQKCNDPVLYTLCDAYDWEGGRDTSRLGIWIRYNRPINE